jgi:hypothetical protein
MKAEKQSDFITIQQKQSVLFQTKHDFNELKQSIGVNAWLAVTNNITNSNADNEKER